MPQSLKELREDIEREEKRDYSKIFKKIGKIRRGEPTEEDREAAIQEEKGQLSAMEKQAEKTGTTEGLAEAFRRKRQRIMKKEGFPGTTSEMRKAGKIPQELPSGLRESAERIGKKKTPKIKLKVR